MSLRQYTRIWEASQARKGDLLVLLAIGDQARDCGFAAISLPVLAQRARCSERQVNRASARLCALGELAERPAAGGHKSKTYRILVGGVDAETWCDRIGTAACHACARGLRRASSRDDKMSPLEPTQGGHSGPPRVDILSPLVPRQGRHFGQPRDDISSPPTDRSVNSITARKQKRPPQPPLAGGECAPSAPATATATAGPQAHDLTPSESTAAPHLTNGAETAATLDEHAPARVDQPAVKYAGGGDAVIARVDKAYREVFGAPLPRAWARRLGREALAGRGDLFARCTAADIRAGMALAEKRKGAVFGPGWLRAHLEAQAARRVQADAHDAAERRRRADRAAQERATEARRSPGEGGAPVLPLDPVARAAAERLVAAIGPDTWGVWFAGTTWSVSDGTVYLATRNGFTADYLRDHFAAALEAAGVRLDSPAVSADRTEAAGSHRCTQIHTEQETKR